MISLLLSVGALVSVATWARVGRRPRPERFLAVHDLPVTGEALELATTYLQRDRWWRLFGAWTGFLIMVVIGVMRSGKGEINVKHLAAIVIGSALGVAWAARPPKPSRAPVVRAASIEVRSVEEYLTARAQLIEAIFAGLLVVSGCVVAVIARTRHSTTSAVTAAVVAVAVAAAFWAIRVLQRSVVESRRPPLGDTLVAADDARRGAVVQSLHHALLAGTCCAGIFLVGAASSIGDRLEVRFDGRVVYSQEAAGESWSASPTRRGGVVLWTTGADGIERHVSVAVPPGADGNIVPDRWEVRGATGAGGISTLGQPTAGLLSIVLVVILTGAALAEWSRIRRAPYQPLLTHPGPKRSRPVSPSPAPLS
jgi:hypothetical protein